MKQTIKKGDAVLVISGKEKGKRGEVMKVLVEKNRVIIEGINMRKRHMKPSKGAPRGGIVEMPGSMHRSNVKLINPSTDKPIRSSKRSGEKK